MNPIPVSASIPLFTSRLNRSALFVLSGFVCAFLFHAVLGRIWGMGWPWNNFLFIPEQRFNDLLQTVSQAASLNPYNDPSIGYCGYPPFSYAVAAATSKVSARIFIPGFLSIVLGGMIGSILLFLKAGSPARSSVLEHVLPLAVLSLFSYPVLFAFDRGNLDLIVVLFCVVSLVLLESKRPVLGAIPLSLAVAFKFFPAIFILPFFRRREYGAGILALSIAAALTVLSLLLFKAPVAVSWAGFQAGLQHFEWQYVVNDYSLHYSLDPVNGMKILKIVAGGHFILDPILAHYTTLTKVFLVLSCFLFAFGRLAMHHRYLLLVLAMLVYPHVANDYKLIFILIPTGAFLVHRHPLGLRDASLLVCMLLLLIPKHYYFLFKDVSISCLIQPAVILAAWVLLVTQRSAWPSGFSQIFRRLRWYVMGLLPIPRAHR